MKQFKCTFVVLIDNHEFVYKLNKQFEYGFIKNKKYQCIVVSRAPQEEIDDNRFLSDFSKKNFVYKRVDEDFTIAQCYNSVLDDIKGEYVCFTNQYCFYDQLSVIALNKATRLKPSVNLVSINYKTIRRKLWSNPKRLNLKCEFVNYNDVEKILTFPPAFFIRTDFIGDTRFNDVCEEETATFFLMNLWKKDSSALVFEKIYCRYDNSFISLKSDNYYGCNNKDYYINSLKDNFLPFIDSFVSNGEEVPYWFQRVAYYRLYFKFYSNYNFRDKALLNDEEVGEFVELSKKLLKHIDADLIFNNEDYQQYVPPFSLRALFMYLKADCDESVLNRTFSIEDDNLYYNMLGSKFNLNNHIAFSVKAFTFRNNCLSLDMKFCTHQLYEYSNNAISVKLNDKEYPCVKNDIYSLQKVFGTSIDKGYTFSVDFPLDELLKPGSKITFYANLDGRTMVMPLDFNRAPSKLNSYCENTYWMLNDSLALVYEDNSLVVKSFTKKELKKRERLYREEAAKLLCPSFIKRNWDKSVISMKRLRKAYYRNKDKFKNRRIWIYFDKLYKAGDNGEYAFRHAMSRDDGIECYYVINKDSLDYPRLKKDFPKNLLIYGTLKCQLYYFLAENIVATHPDIIEFGGISGKLSKVVKDLFNPNLICIAHGITIQKNADYQNRLYDNTMFYTTSSKYEVNHILSPVYGYREDEVALTGLARFDGLKNNDQKQILITPTWRRNIVGGAKRNSTRTYSNLFKNTSYYKVYNSLINDQRIIDVAKETGYKIIFLLHPAMSTQIDDYDRNDYVELIQASGDLNYEEILTQSSLMITDYSGIHYDFGYMRKPVIYYQPKEVPMRFEEGAMKFATMGFGPLCTEYEEAVSLICEYMKNQCKMPQEFKKRADDFFAFDDYNSSERIYDAILKWTNERKNYETK